jgi:hypothetical protein
MTVEESIEYLKQIGLEARFIGHGHPNQSEQRILILTGGSEISDFKLGRFSQLEIAPPEFSIYKEKQRWFVSIEDMTDSPNLYIEKYFDTFEDCVELIYSLGKAV